MHNKIQIWAIAIACAISAIVSAQPAQAVLVYGLTDQNILVSWDSASPQTLQSGVSMGDITFQGLDFRTANGTMYAISQNNLFAVQLPNGGGLNVGLGNFAALNGASFGFDCDPTSADIRMVSDTDHNRTVNAVTGSISGIFTNLAYASGDPNFGANPNVTQTAYSNNVVGAASTTLYGIDAGLDTLVIQGGILGTPSANLGQLTTVGSLGINVAEDGGFDIFTVGGTDLAFAALRPVGSSVSNFYSINLSTGHATLIGEIGGGLNIRAMTVVPGPGALAMMLASAILVRRRRREQF